MQFTYLNKTLYIETIQICTDSWQ